MIVVMSPQATEKEVEAVRSKLLKKGLTVRLFRGNRGFIIEAFGDGPQILDMALEIMPGVEKVISPLPPFKLVSREFKREDTLIRMGDQVIGGKEIHLIAGPCAVEDKVQFLEIAHAVKEAGATFLRGGVYKPRTSPYSFQGLAEEGLAILHEARAQTGLLIVTEVMDPRLVPLVASCADILQIGARNMQNFPLLREVASVDKPILLKRGPAAEIEEWLMAAEYLLLGGNSKVILCERGVKTFERFTRNTLDLSAVPVLQRLSHLPVFVDPSHGTGKWWLVPPMSKAAVAAGADGLLLEVHPSPCDALSDGQQSLTPENFRALVGEVKKVAEAVDRCLPNCLAAGL
ncbi:phospho-2-dehydro-3-deoxyheptonate aldolase AroF [Thermacetogenium phaeum DSM 12270]|uniref:Phospho-2-dehydro-3-deoxyheptonate aldolase AroF n=1 Tax=Thermacetogenium phaeum (strain ATCC BAA-254 / DSM 26808 / PB) TaxID=1089553 RepID=K4LG25_THEPS|nr:3-deoxy-7-phosphoheptulonate synthase [Thermacetogenium phaeum]AFV11778.1 phospho-2-dehydro-3-deoxyheptonate aldolase AroF [Thermacetogenium phaeum DSM 12270]